MRKHEIKGAFKERFLMNANSGLWCKEAEEYLLANAPKVDIGVPKEKITETLCKDSFQGAVHAK